MASDARAKANPEGPRTWVGIALFLLFLIVAGGKVFVHVQHRLARLLEPELAGGVILRVVLVPDLRNDHAQDKQDETHPASESWGSARVFVSSRAA